MQSNLLDIEQSLSQHTQISSKLSFKKFVEHVKCRMHSEQSIRTKFYKFVLEKFNQYPELSDTIALEEIEKYNEPLELIYTSLLPLLNDENASLWGLSTPLLPKIFYGTNGLYKLLQDKNTGKAKLSAIAFLENQKTGRHKIEDIYCLLLEKLYNFHSGLANDMIFSFPNDETNLPKHYKVNIDARFIDVQVNGKLPDLDFEELQFHLNNNTAIVFLEESLPLSMFSFEGFSVVTLTDETESYAVEIIKDTILNHAAYSNDINYNRIVQALKTMCNSNAIDFGLMPMFRINGKLIFNTETSLNSPLIKNTIIQGTEAVYLAEAEKYLEEPRMLIFKTITKEDEEQYNSLKRLKQTGIQSYAVLPVFYNNILAGVLEVFSKEQNILDEKTIAKLDAALPLLSQLMQNSIDEFDAKIDAIIKEQFTSLQPSVYWKFNETAWHYFKNVCSRKDKVEIETVYFENVYPLYGAFDIRNSTSERNNALHADLKIQLVTLVQILTELKKQFNLVLLDEKIFECKEWLNNISENISANDEINLNTFLIQEINSFLLHFKQHYVQAANLINTYFQSTDEQTGPAYENRRALETSMKLINNTINIRLDQYKDELQTSYPCFFEKIRTDGIEYDIYIGQSIAPDKPFDNLYFNNLRLWQLTSMAEITRLTNALLPQLSKPLYTTQLIFAHPNTVDINFRSDERRFDVEGTYNIRYQIIKKRIDKVHIRNTNERLTQPGKIALVYFNQEDANEYIKYMYYLQEQNILTEDLEQLELEELQGVNGLRALRVGVNLD
jgi:hypothetical protein